jgi:hypothetical protein
MDRRQSSNIPKPPALNIPFVTYPFSFVSELFLGQYLKQGNYQHLLRRPRNDNLLSRSLGLVPGC